jgi:hypothetical protein
LAHPFWSNYDVIISNRIRYVLEFTHFKKFEVDPHGTLGVIVGLIMLDNLLGWVLLCFLGCALYKIILSGYALTCSFLLLMLISGHHFISGYYGLLFLFNVWIFENNILLKRA